MEKFKFLYKSFQVILSNKMDSDNHEVIYCPEDDKYRVIVILVMKYV